MTALLVMTGLVMIASATVKLRSGSRTGMGIPIWAPLEALGGLTIAAGAFVAPPTASGGFLQVVMGVSLVVVSSFSLWYRLDKERRRREEISGARLLTYVKYLSSEPDTEGLAAEADSKADPPVL